VYLLPSIEVKAPLAELKVNIPKATVNVALDMSAWEAVFRQIAGTQSSCNRWSELEAL